MERERGVKKEDLRVVHTKAAIRTGFLRLLGRKPIEKISVSEICREAGITRGTFYAHYNDAYHLRDSLEKEIVFAMERRTRELGKKRLTTEDSLRLMAEQRELCGVFAGPYGDHEALLRIIAEQTSDYLLAEQSFVAELDESLAACLQRLMVASAATVIRVWLDGGLQGSPDEVAAIVHTYCLRGLTGFKP